MDELPCTVEEILPTGIVDPEFEAAWKGNGSPQVTLPAIFQHSKKTVQATLPNTQKLLAASRPTTIVEKEYDIPVDDTFSSRTIICQPAISGTVPSPIVILIHGGGHCVGYPEMELATARELVLAFNATCIYRPTTLRRSTLSLPTSTNIFAVVQFIACKAAENNKSILPANVDPKKGFIIGGLSAGAAIRNKVAHLARDLEPPLTRQFLACGIYYDPDNVLDCYKDFYLSMEQNKPAPILDTMSLKQYMNTYKGDKPLQHNNIFSISHCYHSDGTVARQKFLPPVYFQVAGMDPARDDSLIYERVLREECGVPTRIDIYRARSSWILDDVSAPNSHPKTDTRCYRWY
ncbi:hypothetical protein M441DRAFT_91621 [Trichoderma asperellum CBS 433.97]|uniref:Alpha/beta hydrolase fold-3 domain-containing protein n=1 Tax=Trichoderma asperellum (strain ATCC 204424 / CBS 433.97 / NBRC 101777) TaxID=1042311 RepID=A0A2T3YZE7_TRIA4|nr:hypothetical protein M441DRAFT_91621 [Trichoderma asperellum CBS 433.97]PTB37951.1 hypothetical protein M441DRAFT_91621 [Trichoderma asperellum CBS 433.97]